MKTIKYTLILFYLSLIAFLTYGKIITPKIDKIQSLTLLDMNNNPYYYLYNNKEINYVSLENINEKTIKILLNTEDKSFYKHAGFDASRITRALWNNITTKTTIGASTISQQFARNLYLSNEKTLNRKIKEFTYTLRIEKMYSKDEILEGYFNTLYFGHSIYGLYDASYFFFDKHPFNLSISEASILIGIINNPLNYSPIINYEESINKRNIILKSAYKNKIITIEEYQNALSERTIISGDKTQKYGSTTQFYKDMVIDELKGLGYQDYQNLIIHTPYNASLNSFFDTLNIDEDIALVSIENNGGVNLITGSHNYYESSFNRAKSSLPIGSTIKPFLYYQALSCGISPLYELKSEPTSFGDYSPKNNKNIYENSNISMLYALATSDNIYAVKMLEILGIDNLKNILKRVKLNYNNNLSLALGTNEDSLINLTSAYSIFANEGNYYKPFFISSIDSNNENIYTRKIAKKAILSKSICYVLSEMMTSIFDNKLNQKAKVTGSSISYLLTKKYAGKSGTASDNYWMIGYNPLITIGVWSNNDNPKYIWAKMIEHYMKEKENVWYDKPNTVYYKYLNVNSNSTYKKWIAFNSLLPSS